MAAAVVAYLFQKFDQIKSLFDILSPKAEILIVATDLLIVEVDMEQLTSVPSLGHSVHKVQARHRVVSDLWVDADHAGVIERCDKAQHRADGWQVDVAARLVGFWF